MSELKREIKKGRLLKKNGSWMYCEKCNKTVGYLCYSSYSEFMFEFSCKCGSKGLFYLCCEDVVGKKSNRPLKKLKNRLCCPEDGLPLFTIVEKNIKSVRYKITCKECSSLYSDDVAGLFEKK